MRNIKTLSLMTLLTLGTLAGAVTSSSNDYDSATVTNQTTALGSFGRTLTFDVSTGEVTLDSAAVNGSLRPGETYVVTIPVTNTTDRAITLSLAAVSVTEGSGSVASTVTGEAVTLQAGASGELTISITMAGADVVEATTSVSVSYSVNGAASY
ncbi:hypothetical protein [Deinococcus ficus]|jgi:uncharacterized cupredoxin-like copper-binding protein|nr:hypothetical protein [Deinococcus ficus]